MQIADNVVTSFTEEDVRKLGDNAVLILKTVKDLTQPEIMGLVRAIVAESEVEVSKPLHILARPAGPDARPKRTPGPLR